MKIQFLLPFILTILGLSMFWACINEAPQTAYRWKYQDSKSTASFRGLHALNEQDVWVCGNKGTVRKTSDGGKTWEIIKVPNADSLDFRDVHVFNKNEVLLMSAGAGTKSRLYKTADGGKSWNIKKINDLKEGFYNGMAFWDNKNGILAGDPIDGTLYVLKTKDAGESWQRISADKIPPLEEGEYGFAASGTHLITVDEARAYVATGGSVSRIFYTPDRGENWEVKNTPMLKGATSKGIFSIAFSSKKEGIAVGGDYKNDKEKSRSNWIKTNNGGQTWETSNSPLPFQSCIQFIDDWAISVGSSYTYISKNKGANWELLEVVNFNTLSIGGNKDAIFAAGADGRIGRLIKR